MTPGSLRGWEMAQRQRVDCSCRRLESLSQHVFRVTPAPEEQTPCSQQALNSRVLTQYTYINSVKALKNMAWCKHNKKKWWLLYSEHGSLQHQCPGPFSTHFYDIYVGVRTHVCVVARRQLVSIRSILPSCWFWAFPQVLGGLTIRPFTHWTILLAHTLDYGNLIPGPNHHVDHSNLTIPLWSVFEACRNRFFQIYMCHENHSISIEIPEQGSFPP